MNLFKLAEIQLQREGKNNYTDAELLSRAMIIRKWYDKHGTHTAQAIMEGATIYKYGSIIKTY